MSEPFSVERLREMMDGAPPEMREHSTVLWAADEIERLRAVLIKIRDLHQPMWVSEEAKAAGKKPWVCCWCDGAWPCETRLLTDEALAEQENDR